MRKMYIAIPVIAIAAAILGGVYAMQPDRLTPERMKRAVMVESELRKIDETEEQIEAHDDHDGHDHSNDEAPIEVAQAEATDEEEAPAKVVPADTGEAPDKFQVLFETTRGDIVAEFYKEWSPAGVQRVWDLVKIGYYDEVRFFRVLDGFMAQFGVHGDPETNAEWENKGLPSEPVKQSNTPGMITFAMAGRAPRPGWTNETRTTQLFINYGDNNRLDNMGFAPVGRIIAGMPLVEKLYSEYGEGAPNGKGPSQELMGKMGNQYLDQYFPKLDYIKKATIVPEDAMIDGPPLPGEEGAPEN